MSIKKKIYIYIYIIYSLYDIIYNNISIHINSTVYMILAHLYSQISII